jgi:hypothetical protein
VIALGTTHLADLKQYQAALKDAGLLKTNVSY